MRGQPVLEHLPQFVWQAQQDVPGRALSLASPERVASSPAQLTPPRIVADRVQYNPLPNVKRTLMTSLKVAGKCAIDEFMIDCCIAEGCDIFHVLRESVKFGGE
jgi:hypothetical protein